MRLALAAILVAVLWGCAAEEKRFEWGAETDAPLGWIAMCIRNPEAFSCPD